MPGLAFAQTAAGQPDWLAGLGTAGHVANKPDIPASARVLVLWSSVYGVPVGAETQSEADERARRAQFEAGDLTLGDNGLIYELSTTKTDPDAAIDPTSSQGTPAATWVLSTQPGIDQADLDELEAALRGAGASTETLAQLRTDLDNVVANGGGVTQTQVNQTVDTAVASLRDGADPSNTIATLLASIATLGSDATALDTRVASAESAIAGEPALRDAAISASVSAAIAGADFDKRLPDVATNATTFPAGNRNEWFYIAGPATLDSVAVTEGVYRCQTDNTATGTPAEWVRDEVLWRAIDGAIITSDTVAAGDTRPVQSGAVHTAIDAIPKNRIYIGSFPPATADTEDYDVWIDLSSGDIYHRPAGSLYWIADRGTEQELL